MKAYRDKDGKLKRKMVKYLGKDNSKSYKKMAAAILRRNRIQALQKQLKRLVEQQQPLPKRSTRKRSSSNTPLTSSDRVLLLQLQQQLAQLMRRFERLYKEMRQLKQT